MRRHAAACGSIRQHAAASGNMLCMRLTGKMSVHAISASIARTALAVASYAAFASRQAASSSSLGGQCARWYSHSAALSVWTVSIEIRSA